MAKKHWQSSVSPYLTQRQIAGVVEVECEAAVNREQKTKVEFEQKRMASKLEQSLKGSERAVSLSSLNSGMYFDMYTNGGLN